MKYENIKPFVGKYVRVHVGGGYHEGILYEDPEFKYGTFYMKERIDCYVSKSQTQSFYSDIPCYFQSIDGIKKIEEVNADGDSC